MYNNDFDAAKWQLQKEEYDTFKQLREKKIHRIIIVSVSIILIGCVAMAFSCTDAFKRLESSNKLLYSAICMLRGIPTLGVGGLLGVIINSRE